MKNLYRMLISILLIFVVIPMLGQTNLENWVAKCEKIESVDITVIRKKDPDTGKLIRDLKTISFKNNESLYKELIEACKKDEDKAYQVIQDRKGGKGMPRIYQFRVGEMTHQYIFSISEDEFEDESVSVTVIVRNKKDKDNGSATFNFNMGDFNYSNMESMGLEMRAMGEEIRVRMKNSFSNQ